MAAGLVEATDGMQFAFVDYEEAVFLYEEIVTRRTYLREGITLPDRGVVLDVGANIGIFALLCCREQPALEVHALEPALATYEVLARNAAAYPRLQTHRVAIRSPADAVHGVAELHYFPGMPGESTFHPDESTLQQRRLGRPPHVASTERCPVATLSAFLRAESIDRVALLKVDVEGDELGVLQSLTDPEDWARIDQVVVEVHDVAGRVAAAAALLTAHGFAVVQRAQRSELVDGYQTDVPAELGLYILYAQRADQHGAHARKPKKTGSTVGAHPGLVAP